MERVASDFGNLAKHERRFSISALHLRSLQLRVARQLNTAGFELYTLHVILTRAALELHTRFVGKRQYAG
jgi:hypothetical protein